MAANLNKWILLVLFSHLFEAEAGQDSTKGCYIDVPQPWPSVVTSKRPHEYVRTSELPTNFDWRLVNETCYVTPVTNQFLPKPCGACWALASTGALTDRFIIATGAKQPVVPLSAQVLMDCSSYLLTTGSCGGGSDILAYEFISKYGITDITCSPYMGEVFTNWGELPCQERMCRKCDRFGSCGFTNGTVYHVSEYGSVTGVDEMMAEIYTRGPIACSVYAHGDSFDKYTGGVIRDPTDYNETTHDIVLTGWGVEETSGLKYWVGRNSYGTTWGEMGWFKLERGSNCLNIERHPCAWAVPKLN